MKRLLYALMMCAAWSARAHAEDTLILFEADPARPGLCGALRIQLTDLATVRCQPGTSGPLDQRITMAAQAVSSAGARLGVLLEQDPDPAQLRMLVVGAAPDRALLAVERVEARPEPDVDRALALKVRETLEVSLIATRAGADHVPLVTPARVGADLALVELGATVQSEGRLAGLLAFGVRRERAARYGELALQWRRPSSTTARLAGGSVHEHEWTLGLSGRGGWRRGRFAYGPTLAISLARASAHGETADGRRGDASLFFARLELGLELRWLLWNGPAPVQLRFAPVLELDPVAQQFALDARTVLDLGRARAVFPLSVVIGLPWGGST